MASSGEDKLLKVWSIDNWRPVPKRVVSIAFNSQGSQIITADKFGDVYRYPINASNDNQNAVDLLLGHVSMVTDMILTPNNKFIITADRDEHIRVSRFPKGHNIESYCLGHTQFLSKLHILPWSTDFLLSAGEQNEKKLLTSEYNNNEFAVTTITSSSISKHIALVIEKFPGVVILNWNETNQSIEFKTILYSSIDPLDIAYDLRGNLWVSNSLLSDDDDKDDKELITLFIRNEDNDRYEKSSSDHPLLIQINKYGSVQVVDKIPDLYPIGQLLESNEESQNNDNAVNKSSISKTQEKKPKRNVEKKKIKLK
ncbi:8658_t:CDS:2 [Entrophospora sp. SA101]|nr:1849_t:CDS:2 [Entrophospora sp. SA101]CAJ0634338.1 8658_t:CDS:2 [Entrophospora sp. SA101]CAJ0829366.1 5656_t:CDS:2 [Entrophospora sp. SA101]CAJ0842398.1 6749_t:CDS:2 [Entrophospora sp. SA101]CAJ0923355.1 20864_t:CDS:2 [Entrophospora sp. SA101]